MLSRARSHAARRRGRRRRRRVERHQHRHRAVALVRPDAAVPGMGYPLVPGYELVGRVRRAPEHAPGRRVGERVFVPGARCFGEVRGLFGGAAARVVVPGVARDAGSATILASRACCWRWPPPPITRSLAVDRAAGSDRRAWRPWPAARAPRGRCKVAMPVVWETQPAARAGRCRLPGGRSSRATTRRDYRAIYDVSGDARLLDTLIGRLAPGGEVVLAGFYSEPLAFAFPPAFMREARIRVAAEWRQPRPGCRQRADRAGPAVARRPDHPSLPRRRRRPRPTAPPSTTRPASR